MNIRDVRKRFMGKWVKFSFDGEVEIFKVGLIRITHGRPNNYGRGTVYWLHGQKGRLSCVSYDSTVCKVLSKNELMLERY